ncbi:hypothetical protein AGLY_015055 [Aphis glycines]|uniref:Uncharacterized protein n=1 Tax=Aphis glycines TaxID=307491 RepID=A0A6G0T3T9_APHGL|nr:hypothetical protein AGLY_015055 [Aphis glycines]
MMSTTDNFEVTSTGASETPVPAVGSGSSQKSSASSQNPEMRVSSQAPISGNITAETVVPPGTQRNQASDRDLIANMKSDNRTAQRKVIDIGVLTEDELLCKLRGQGRNNDAIKECKSVHTQTQEYNKHIVGAASAPEHTAPSLLDRACSELLACIEVLWGIITTQGENVG